MQNVEMPDRSRRTGMFDRQLSLERTACPTKQSMIGALVRAALACQGKNKQQSGE